MIRPVLLVVLLLTATNSEVVAQSSQAEDFDQTVRTILARWGDPGVVLTIVKDGRAIVQKGFGETKLSGGEPVTPTTLTSVASVTKTVNSTALAMLVADGAIRWDDPIKTLFPEFRFVDEYRTESTTIKDLITHRAGLPAVMGGIRSLDYSIEDLFRDLPSEDPLTDFRERVEYSQVGIALLGEVVRRGSGMPWAEFVRNRIFEPLGMESSYPSTLAFLASYPQPDAVPNLMGRVRRRDGEYVAGPWRGAGNIYSPAGGMVTTGEDMARFMRFLLAGGVANGRELVPAELISELQRPQGVEGTPYGPVVSPFGGLVAYGMGWISHDFEGRRVVEHPGSNFGTSVVALIPDERVGVFVSTSATFSLDSDRLVSALKFAGLSHALGLEQQDWIALFEAGR